jgi:hypothetical protein
MPQLYDRRSGLPVARFSNEEYLQLKALLEAPPSSEEPEPVDSEALERLSASGVSDRVLTVLQQILQDREDFVPGWEPD